MPLQTEEERKLRELFEKQKLSEKIEVAFLDWLLTGKFKIEIEEQQCNEK